MVPSTEGLLWSHVTVTNRYCHLYSLQTPPRKRVRALHHPPLRSDGTMQSQLPEWRPPPFVACVAPCISRGSSWRRPCGMYSRSDVFGQRPCHPSVDATCETPMGAAGCMSGRGQKTTYLVHSSSCLMSIEKMGRGTEGQCTYTEGNDTRKSSQSEWHGGKPKGMVQTG